MKPIIIKKQELVVIPEMKVIKTELEGLLIIERDPWIDPRGPFREVYRESVLGVEFKPIQMNHSKTETNGLRGVHAERWNKLVYPLTGIVFIALVDLRENSETFGKHVELTFDNEKNLPNKAIFISNGIGNSICAIKGPVEYIYAVDAYWTPNSSFAINPFDPDLAINWPVSEPIIYQTDNEAPTMRERFPDKYK